MFLFGDSSCADDAALGRLKSTRDGGVGDCLWLFKSAVRYACEVRRGNGNMCCRDSSLFSRCLNLEARVSLGSGLGFV